MLLTLTKNHFVVALISQGINKEDGTHGGYERTWDDYYDYAIIKREDGKLKRVNTYLTSISFDGGIVGTTSPVYLENKDKIYMFMCPFDWDGNIESLNQKGMKETEGGSQK